MIPPTLNSIRMIRAVGFEFHFSESESTNSITKATVPAARIQWKERANSPAGDPVNIKPGRTLTTPRIIAERKKVAFVCQVFQVGTILSR